MSNADDTPLIVDPMRPDAIEGYVEAVNPPNAKLKMTADAAEISAIRLLDAAAKARDELSKPSRIALRGFASMTPERRSEIARKGGKSVPRDKRSFSQDPKLASEAGRKGGLMSPTRREEDESGQ